MSKKTTKVQRKKRRRLKILLFFEILILILAVLFGVYYFFFSKIQHEPGGMDDVTINDFDDSNIGDYQNIALFGVDSQTNSFDDTRSDAIMVLSINKKTKDMKLLSIYRDTYVNVEGHGLTKINHAYAYGGPGLAVSTINQNLDLNIKNYVTVNFKALANAVDALGGVELDIQEYEIKNLNNYIGNMNKINGGNSPKIQTAGTQTLDGNQAVAYSRIRYSGNGDFERAERQRRVLAQILVKAKKSNPITLVKLVNGILPQIKTSFDSIDILALAKDVGSYEIIENSSFPFKQEGRRIGGVYYGVPITLESNVIEAHKFLFGTENFTPSSTVKEISSRIGG